METRLSAVASEGRLETIDQLIERLRSSPSGSSLELKVVDALTTNETSFFRDVHPFMALEKHVIPELMEERAADRTLRIWCAACSTGQEPITIAMILRDAFPQLRQWKVDLVGTDLSSEVLAAAREGKYRQFEVGRGLPAAKLAKHFDRAGTSWKVKPEILSMIDYQPLNLLQRWPAMGTFDIVFLRNVLIYFDLAVKEDIVRRVHRVLAPDGYLFMGAAETMINMQQPFERVTVGRAIAYRPKKA